MTILIALLGGIITFISPCVLPLIPMYIAYISGISIQELKSKDSSRPIPKIFINSIFFVLGFTVVFSLLAALFYIFVQSLGEYKVWFNRVAGAIIVVFGLHIMGVIRLNFLNYQVKANIENKNSSFLSSALMGMAFGAGWTPCIGPILSGILFTASSSSNPTYSVLLLVVYSLGLGIPFILTGLLTSSLLRVFDSLKRHYKTIEIVSGIFLILLGIMLMFDLTGIISSAFSRLFPNSIELEQKFLK